MTTEKTTLWVSPGGSDEERGTFEHPFGDIDEALARVQPGQQILLMDGTYKGNVTINQSGSREHPVRIGVADDATAIIDSSSWFLYDVSDMVIEGLTFRNSTGTALSIVGKCERNRFADLKFIDCGLNDSASCTLFFGGVGANCTVVENCDFTRSRPQSAPGDSIAILLLEGDAEGGVANTDFMIRKNSFSHYGFAVLAGSRDTTRGQYGHVVEYNTISECSAGGILVRCGDTTIRGNVIRAIGREAISVLAGVSSTIIDNRVVECGTGICVAGNGHTVENNCIVRCSSAIRLAGRIREEIEPASAVLVDRNTIVDSGWRASGFGVTVDAGASCITEGNLVCGSAKPLEATAETADAAGAAAPLRKRAPRLLSRENAVCGYAGDIEGFTPVKPDFVSPSSDDYSNSSGYGAQGWMLSPNPYEPDTTAAESLAGMAHADEEDLDIEEEAPAPAIADDEESAPFNVTDFFMGDDDGELSTDSDDDMPGRN